MICAPILRTITEEAVPCAQQTLLLLQQSSFFLLTQPEHFHIQSFCARPRVVHGTRAEFFRNSWNRVQARPPLPCSTLAARWKIGWSMAASHAVLYRNETLNIALIDIPASIEHGQQSCHTLRSCPALEGPYASTEPKGSKRDVAINGIPVSEQIYHRSIQTDITTALVEIRNHLLEHGGGWCLRRCALLPHDDSRVSTPGRPGLWPASNVSTDHESPVIPVILSSTEPCNEFHSLQILHGAVAHNPRQLAVVVQTTDEGNFIIPPGSTFLLSTLDAGHPSFAACRDLTLLPTMFDLVLMDPPWTNRSVRHSGAYKTAESQPSDPFQEAVRAIKDRLTAQGLAAVWVTNKASVRAVVMQTLQAMGMYLDEEWVWIKTTTHGVPVTPLDGVWRRPYEVLLLFRRGQFGHTPRRRVIAAVPDLHSRKPCLKSLLEDLLPAKYNALELFARSLTAGWWSWGEEVLKFQHESQWVNTEREL